MAGALTVLAMSCSTASAQAGTGLEPGVHIDPGSPAAKEYALPLNQARQTGSQSSARGSSSGPLFGAGIGPPGAGGSSPSPSGSAKAVRAGRASRAGGANTAGLQAALPSSVLHVSSSPASSGGSGSSLALLGGAVAILVLGGFGGTVLKRSRHSTPSA